jgi:hypothetical protein
MLGDDPRARPIPGRHTADQPANSRRNVMWAACMSRLSARRDSCFASTGARRVLLNYDCPFRQAPVLAWPIFTGGVRGP